MTKKGKRGTPAPAAREPSYELVEGYGDGEVRHAVGAGCRKLRITTSRGAVIEVELWERHAGRVLVSGINGGLVVRPWVTNEIHVEGDGRGH